MAASISFPNTYQESREEFLKQFQTIQERWSSARFENRPLSNEDDLQIEWIAADALKSPQKVLMITCGIHGVEGYVGAAMRSLFLTEFLNSLDPEMTGLYLVHAINPWGMKVVRRVTRNNVDLNRNFVLADADFKEAINPDYQLYDHILNPDRPLRSLGREMLGVIGNIAANLIKAGVKTLRNVVMQGQRSNPAGLYYSGTAHEPETEVLMGLIREVFGRYPQALLIDMHTGYGPKDQMSLINSPLEERSTEQLVKDFKYPRILKADPEDFYVMQGDMVDWLYRYRQSAGLNGKFYGVGFEFGTIGNTIPHEFISLWNMIFENQAYWKGAETEAIKNRVNEIFREMYFPTGAGWREKALADCRQALRGVLRAEGFLE